MKNASRITLVLLLISSGSLRGDTPWCEAEISPSNPTSTDIIDIVLSGWWGDSCVPNDSSVSVVGNSIYVDVIWDYPPGIVCLAVISDWTLPDEIGLLPPGIYTVYGRVVGYLFPTYPSTYEPLANFVVSDKQFVLSTETLVVPENGSAVFSVRLLKDPLQRLDVAVARTSGDADITVQSGASLTFDSYNYTAPQTVTLAAADDDDYLEGTAVISITAPEYSTAELTAIESDSDLPTVLYVDANAPGNNDGTSWTNAFTSLQDALGITASYPTVEEIRIAQGTYTPAGPDGNRKRSFQLEDIALIGGFAGNSRSTPNLRNSTAYKTILSGDLNGNDGPPFLNNEENSEKVVFCRGNVTLDGIAIRGGNGGSGAGIYNWTGCVLRMMNCRVIGNYGGYGAGMFSNEGDVDVRNCLFAGNSTNFDGGGLYNNGHIKMALVNCTFGQNSADKGAAIDSYPHYVQLELRNCIFWGNTASSGTGEVAQIDAGPMTISNCCVQGWTGTLGGTGNHGADPCFADTGSGDYHLKSQAGRWNPDSETWVIDEVASPCIDAGSPMSPIGPEPFPNSGIINIGAYGGTGEASKSYFGKPPCETIMAGDVNGDCEIDFEDFRLMALHWCEDNNP